MIYFVIGILALAFTAYICKKALKINDDQVRKRFFKKALITSFAPFIINVVLIILCTLLIMNSTHADDALFILFLFFMFIFTLPFPLTVAVAYIMFRIIRKK